MYNMTLPIKKNKNEHLAQIKCPYFEFRFFIKVKFAEEITIIIIIIIIMIKIPFFVQIS